MSNYEWTDMAEHEAAKMKAEREHNLSRPKGERDVEERMDEWLYGEEQPDIETVRKLRARYLNDVYFHTAVQHLIRADSPQYVVNVLARLEEPDVPEGEEETAADVGECDVARRVVEGWVAAALKCYDQDYRGTDQGAGFYERKAAEYVVGPINHTSPDSAVLEPEEAWTMDKMGRVIKGRIHRAPTATREPNEREARPILHDRTEDGGWICCCGDHLSPSERASTAADGGWQDGEWDDALRAAWAVVVEAAQDSSLWGGTVASAFRAIHKRLDAAVQPPSVAKALAVWRRHAEDAEEWAAISDLEKALAHPSPSEPETDNGADGGEVWEDPDFEVEETERAIERGDVPDEGDVLGELARIAYEVLAREPHPTVTADLRRRFGAALPCTICERVHPPHHACTPATDESIRRARERRARPESREGADELHDLIAKGYVEEAAQKARSMASARLSRGPLNE